MTIEQLHKIFLQCSGISTDTRKIGAGSLFFAIKGERYDANQFAADALDKGASYVVIDNAEYYLDHRTILVADSLQTLQQLAAFHRRVLGIPVIGLTGSNGKTTTKELINAVLATKFCTGATVGNLNNHIGVPLTLLSFDAKTEIGIVEMGANHQKEIEFLCGIAQPDFGYITNFGKAHLEGFGGIEGVIKGKSELYAYLRANSKTAFVNADDELQMQKTADMQRITFGEQGNADVVIERVTADPFVTSVYEGTSIRSQLIGLYNANNIHAAICIGLHFKVGLDQLRSAIEAYIPENNRSQLMTRAGNEIILDAYNANPSSMAAAIANFVQLDKPAKLMVLGDMFELGQEASAEHGAIVASVIGAGVETHFIGNDFFAHYVEDPMVKFHRSAQDFAASGIFQEAHGRTVLVKGSRGMALERLLDVFAN